VEDVTVGMFTIPLPERKWTMASSFGLSSEAFSSYRMSPKRRVLFFMSDCWVLRSMVGMQVSRVIGPSGTW